ncbi:MAG: hypothetical protein LBS17_02400, partial [Actinomycetes bacterium]|nr:hypothetical protein [Actinomycetes bacterium]
MKRITRILTIALLLIVGLTIPASTFAVTRPAAPDALRVKRTSATSLKLWWAQVKGASGYAL